MFDQSRVYLGELCRRNHDYLDSKKSLRYIRFNNCCECSKINSEKAHDKKCKKLGIMQRGSHEEIRKNKQQCKEKLELENRKIEKIKLDLAEKVTREYPFDSNILFLGNVCDYDHKYCGFSFSLRYKSNNRCQECSIIHDLDRKFTREKKPCSKERGREKSREFRRKNPDKIRAYNQKWYKKNWGDYYHKNREALVNKGRNNNHSRKSLQKDYIPTQDLTDYKARFNHCIYCQKETDYLTLDHVVALSKGGSHSLDNIVFCCRSCNSSKNASDLLDWSLDMFMRHDFDHLLCHLRYRVKDIIREYNLSYNIP